MGARSIPLTLSVGDPTHETTAQTLTAVTLLGVRGVPFAGESLHCRFLTREQ